MAKFRMQRKEELEKKMAEKRGKEHECDCKKHDCDCQKEHEHKCDCDCGENCDCGCQEGKECICDCDENCECGCHDDECDCGCDDDRRVEEALSYLQMAQRLQAEFDNYRKRTVEIEKQARDRGIMQAVEKLLPVIDSINNAKRQVSDKNFLKALDLVYTQTLKGLGELGVKKIEALNKEFDPNFHNAVIAEQSGGVKGIVVEELQEGFTLNGNVIRHTVCKVNK